MTTEALQISQPNEFVYTPPTLPSHLSGIYSLNPITGHPSNEEVKAIHAAIRAVNAEAQIPHLYNPDLSLELSQHLFNVQMTVYRKAYPLSVFPGEHTYTPPSLPAHIPVALEPVVGNPTREQVRVVQNAIRIAESLGSSPLFDADLNVDLSQHLFNLQFARYVQSSTLGQFNSKPQEPQRLSDNTQGLQFDVPDLQNNSPNPQAQSSTVTPPNPTQSNDLETRVRPSLLDESGRLESGIALKITEQGEAINSIKELMSESKGVLENINRVLIATQRNQVMAGSSVGCNFVFVNPVNQEGVTAVECGLPPLRYYHYSDYLQGSGNLNLTATQVASYLKFFNVGADLMEEDQEPRLKDGKQNEAEILIIKHIGLLG